MALFFDAAWFDGQLERLHLGREHLGAMIGLDPAAVAELWKDQRELTAADVAVIAALFNVPPAEIANRAGISTPVPRAAEPGHDAIAGRLDVIEAKIDEVLRRLPPRA